MPFSTILVDTDKFYLLTRTWACPSQYLLMGAVVLEIIKNPCGPLVGWLTSSLLVSSIFDALGRPLLYLFQTIIGIPFVSSTTHFYPIKMVVFGISGLLLLAFAVGIRFGTPADVETDTNDEDGPWTWKKMMQRLWVAWPSLLAVGLQYIQTFLLLNSTLFSAYQNHSIFAILYLHKHIDRLPRQIVWILFSFQIFDTLLWIGRSTIMLFIGYSSLWKAILVVFMLQSILIIGTRQVLRTLHKV